MELGSAKLKVVRNILQKEFCRDLLRKEGGDIKDLIGYNLKPS